MNQITSESLQNYLKHSVFWTILNKFCYSGGIQYFCQIVLLLTIFQSVSLREGLKTWLLSTFCLLPSAHLACKTTILLLLPCFPLPLHTFNVDKGTKVRCHNYSNYIFCISVFTPFLFLKYIAVVDTKSLVGFIGK